MPYINEVRVDSGKLVCGCGGKDIEIKLAAFDSLRSMTATTIANEFTGCTKKAA